MRVFLYSPSPYFAAFSITLLLVVFPCCTVCALHNLERTRQDNRAHTEEEKEWKQIQYCEPTTLLRDSIRIESSGHIPQPEGK